MASSLFSLDTKHGKQKFRTPFSFIKKPPLAWGFAAARAACAVQYFIRLQTIAEVPEFSSALDFLSDESCRDEPLRDKQVQRWETASQSPRRNQIHCRHVPQIPGAGFSSVCSCGTAGVGPVRTLVPRWRCYDVACQIWQDVVEAYRHTFALMDPT